jgi:hypothetical protein
VTYDKITTGIKLVGTRYCIWIRYENSDTGKARHELSARSWRSSSRAEEVAIAVAEQLQAAARLQASQQ